MARIYKGHGPKEPLAIVERRQGCGYPEDGVRPCLPLVPHRFLWGRRPFWGKHVTLYISSPMSHYGFVKKSLPTDIYQISLRYLSAVLLIFIKDRFSGWAAKYRQ